MKKFIILLFAFALIALSLPASEKPVSKEIAVFQAAKDDPKVCCAAPGTCEGYCCWRCRY